MQFFREIVSFNPRKKFRQINFLVEKICVCHKTVLNFMTFFLKKFREIVLQSILLKKLISRNFCFVKLEFRYLCVPIHTVEITEIYSY